MSTNLDNKKVPAQKGTYYEKYFDDTNQLPYFYNPATKESLWAVPDGSIVADMTIALQKPD